MRLIGSLLIGAVTALVVAAFGGPAWGTAGLGYVAFLLTHSLYGLEERISR